MAVPYKKQAGFTLIELLIATSLLSMIIYLGNYAYSMFSNSWNGRLGHFNQTAESAKGFNLLYKVLTATTPVLVNNKDGEVAIYFYGQEQGVRGVSQSGIFTTDFPVVYELSLSGSRLIYSERAINDFVLIDSEQQIDFTHTFVVFDNIASLKLSYFGWRDYIAKGQVNNISAVIPEKSWYGQYLSEDRQLSPEKINLTVSFQANELNRAEVAEEEHNLLFSLSTSSDFVLSRDIGKNI